MLSLFKKIFGEKTDKPKTTTVHDKYNMISFYLDEWNRYHIFVSMDINNESAIAEFGKLLYLINSGKYEKDILDYMVSVAKDKPFLTKPIQESLISWALCIKQNMETKNDTPYVRPTQVFR